MCGTISLFFPPDLSLWFRALTSYKINPWRAKTMRALKRASPHHQRRRRISEHWEHCPSCKPLNNTAAQWELAQLHTHIWIRQSYHSYASSRGAIAILATRWFSKEFSKKCICIHGDIRMCISRLLRSVFLISAVTSWRVKPDSHKCVRSQKGIRFAFSLEENRPSLMTVFYFFLFG